MTYTCPVCGSENDEVRELQQRVRELERDMEDLTGRFNRLLDLVKHHFGHLDEELRGME